MLFHSLRNVTTGAATGTLVLISQEIPGDSAAFDKMMLMAPSTEDCPPDGAKGLEILFNLIVLHQNGWLNNS